MKVQALFEREFGDDESFVIEGHAEILSRDVSYRQDEETGEESLTVRISWPVPSPEMTR